MNNIINLSIYIFLHSYEQMIYDKMHVLVICQGLIIVYSLI